MGSFNASLRTIGDRRGLPATVTIDGGRISIDAGEHSIGEWALDEVHLEITENGYRMAAEGEQILLEVQDSETFEIELRGRTVPARKRPRIRASRPKAERPQEQAAPTSQATLPKVEPTNRATLPKVEPTSRVTLPKVQPEPPKEQIEKETGRLMTRVDGVITAAERRWGSLLPSWVFTRKVVAILLGAIVLTIIFPGIISTVLLLAGLLMVLGGAIVYTDNVMAARWLPGRMTPMHVLISGVAVLMFGVLIGVIA